jgi:hypothetical protein
MTKLNPKFRCGMTGNKEQTILARMADSEEVDDTSKFVW